MKHYVLDSNGTKNYDLNSRKVKCEKSETKGEMKNTTNEHRYFLESNF